MEFRELTFDKAFKTITNGKSIKQKREAGGIPITRIETIADRTVDESKFGYADIKDISKYSNHILNEGDILLSHINSLKHIGKTALFNDLGYPVIHGMNLLRLQVTDGILDPLYAFYYLQTDLYKNQILKFVKKSVNQVSVPVSSIKRIKIIFPKGIENQKRIAQVLSNCEGLIQKRKESIALLDELLKSTFLEMFGDPVRNEKGWNIVSLSKFGTIDRGVSKHRPRNEPKLLEGKHPLIQTGDVASSDTYIEKYKQTYSDIGLAQSKKWPIGTLCITIAANIAKTGILKFQACFPDSIVGFVVDKREATNLYVHHLFSFFQRILEKNAPSAAQKNINLGILRNFKVPQPPVELQLKFDEIVLKVESIKQSYKIHLKELEDLHDSISQKAFKGELDLSEVILKKRKTVKVEDIGVNAQKEKVNSDFTKPSINDIENILNTAINDGFNAKLFSVDDIERVLLEKKIIIDNNDIKKHLRNAMSHNEIAQEFSGTTKQVMFKLK